MANPKQDEPKVEAPAPAQEPSIKGAESPVAAKDSKVAGGRPDGQILTGAPPADADKSSYPNAMDAKLDDPPVRTTKVDEPLVVASASGAGKHEPPDPDLFHPDGRPRTDGNP